MKEIENKSGMRIFLDMGMPIDLPEKGEFSSSKITKKSYQDLIDHQYLPAIDGEIAGSFKFTKSQKYRHALTFSK
ncbi:MAG: hypothetical protein HQK54_18120 [Oligoflexales bacterium]|nr:hypothetical protein [Oligoflexales bacterium]